MVDRDAGTLGGKGIGHHPAQPSPRTRDQGDAALQLHQRGPADTGEIGRTWPVIVAPGAASDMTPSVISCISTYWASVSPAAATLSTVRTIAGAMALTRTCRSFNSRARL